MSAETGTSKALGLIGGIGLTEVHVYARRRAPDGNFSGCPHVHAVTDEGYYVLTGTGRVEFHDLDHLNPAGRLRYQKWLASALNRYL